MKAEPRPTGQRLDTAVLRDTREFASLEEEWDDLYRHSPRATPFQSWAWLYSWWEYYGEGYELRLVTVRGGEGMLIGVLPLMLERRWGFGRLLFVGSGKSTYLDMLVREVWEGAVVEAGAAALERMGSWQVADLQELRPQAAAWTLFRNWVGPRACAYQAYCALVAAKPWEELLASVSKSLRRETRRSLRQAAAEGARWELAETPAAEQAAGRMVALNRKQWRERWQDTSPEHWTQAFETHLQTAARRMTSYGLGGISEFRRGEETILSTFLLFGRDSVGFYMVGADREALGRYTYSSLLVWDMLNIARDRNVPYIDFFAGDEAYKLRWNPKVIYKHRIILGRNLSYWSPYAGYLVWRSKAVRYAMSEDSPEWAREAAHRYVRLRYKVARLVKQTSGSAAKSPKTIAREPTGGGARSRG
jgi:CelD/BcsL family acetyltransferase involved in cellulose biosynthesis